MRFTVDFEIPLVVGIVVVIRIIKVKYIFTICIYPILLWWNPSHSLALHFTHSKWSILFYIFMSFNQPRQLYSTNPYDTGMRENVECMIMVYNVQQWKRWWWEVQEGVWMDGNKTIYSLHSTLLKHENEFYIRCLLFLRCAIDIKALGIEGFFMCGMVNTYFVWAKNIFLLCIHMYISLRPIKRTQHLSEKYFHESNE